MFFLDVGKNNMGLSFLVWSDGFFYGFLVFESKDKISKLEKISVKKLLYVFDNLIEKYWNKLFEWRVCEYFCLIRIV